MGQIGGNICHYGKLKKYREYRVIGKPASGHYLLLEFKLNNLQSTYTAPDEGNSFTGYTHILFNKLQLLLVTVAVIGIHVDGYVPARVTLSFVL